MKRFKNNVGFTMIELLVVISIIGILAALAMVSFGGSQKQARDAARKSDLKQYSTTLEAFANSNGGLYPARTDASGITASTTLCSDLNLSSCSEDAKNDSDSTFYYRYQSSGSVSDGSAAATRYILWAKLENTDDYWVVCSSGKTGAISQSSFAASLGTCPL